MISHRSHELRIPHLLYLMHDRAGVTGRGDWAPASMYASLRLVCVVNILGGSIRRKFDTRRWNCNIELKSHAGLTIRRSFLFQNLFLTSMIPFQNQLFDRQLFKIIETLAQFEFSVS